MARGTFANIRLKNMLVPGSEGSVTVHYPTGEQTSIYDAAMKYKEAGTPFVVLAGSQYGTGSSRDWAPRETWTSTNRNLRDPPRRQLRSQQAVEVTATKTNGDEVHFLHIKCCGI